MYKCKTCKKEFKQDNTNFPTSYDNTEYCSFKCHKKDQKEYTRRCLYCRKKFKTTKKGSWYCCPMHRRLNLKMGDECCI